MMIIIKEAYLRDILVLKFPPSGRQVCQPLTFCWLGSLSLSASPLGGFRWGKEAMEVPTNRTPSAHTCAHTCTHTTTISLQT